MLIMMPNYKNHSLQKLHSFVNAVYRVSEQE